MNLSRRSRMAPDGLSVTLPWRCFAARIIWVLNSAAHADLIERNIRKKVLAPDFRWTSGDSRLALAHLCALQGRYDEAVRWFAKAREVHRLAGGPAAARDGRYDEGLMYLRRRVADSDRARPFFEGGHETIPLARHGNGMDQERPETAAEMIEKP